MDFCVLSNWCQEATNVTRSYMYKYNQKRPLAPTPLDSELRVKSTRLRAPDMIVVRTIITNYDVCLLQTIKAPETYARLFVGSNV